MHAQVAVLKIHRQSRTVTLCCLSLFICTSYFCLCSSCYTSLVCATAVLICMPLFKQQLLQHLTHNRSFLRRDACAKISRCAVELFLQPGSSIQRGTDRKIWLGILPRVSNPLARPDIVVEFCEMLWFFLPGVSKEFNSLISLQQHRISTKMSNINRKILAFTKLPHVYDLSWSQTSDLT